MKHIMLTSSALRSAGYDLTVKVLEVRFSSTEVYSYFNVPPEVFIKLVNAPSVGEYFNDHIKGRYSYEEHAFQPQAKLFNHDEVLYEAYN